MFWAVTFLFFVGLFLGRCLRPGLLRARFARFLLRKEPSPAYPYRVFYKILRLEIGIDDFGVKKHVTS